MNRRAMNRRAMTLVLLGAALATTMLTTDRVEERVALSPPRATPPPGHPLVLVPGVAATRSGTPPHASGPGESRPLEGARAREALVHDLEDALGGRVAIRWDRGRPLAPRTITISGAPSRAGSPSLVAGSFVASIADALGASVTVVAAGEPVPAAGLALVAAEPLEDEASAIVELAAFEDGLPIEDGTIRFELRRATPESSLAWAPARLAGRFHLAATLEGSVSAAVEASLEDRYPPLRGEGFVARSSWRLVAHETGPGVYRRAFEVTTAAAPGEARRDLVDAETGERLASSPIACAGTARVHAWEHDPAGGRDLLVLPELSVAQGTKRVVTKPDGTFPLTGEVTLPEGFSGPLVRVVPAQGAAFAYSGPADFELLARSTDAKTVHQDEASAFVHAVEFNGYMRVTYPAIVKAAGRRFAIVVGARFANAFFTPTPVTLGDGSSFPGYLELGTIDARSVARDESVVEHEYTHALLSGVASLFGSDEALGVNEGLADYFPCARAEDPRVGAWVQPPYFRALDDRPRRLVWGHDATRRSDPHKIGNVFNQALWGARAEAEHRKAGERLRVDKAVFAGVLRMPDDPSLEDARDAVLAADAALGAGAHQGAFEAAFAAHGLRAGPDPGDDEDTADAPDERSSDAVKFTAPRRRSYVVHTGETVAIPVEVTSATGAKVALEAKDLVHATFESHPGKTATGRLVYSPTEADRGRRTVTLRASVGGETATRVLTFVVRRRRT